MSTLFNKRSQLGAMQKCVKIVRRNFEDLVNCASGKILTINQTKEKGQTMEYVKVLLYLYSESILKKYRSCGAYLMRLASVFFGWFIYDKYNYRKCQIDHDLSDKVAKKSDKDEKMECTECFSDCSDSSADRYAHMYEGICDRCWTSLHRLNNSNKFYGPIAS